MSKKIRKGFDYFIDKYEVSYTDDYDNEYFDDEYVTNERFSIPGDRFKKYNKYTGEEAGKQKFIEPSNIYERQQKKSYSNEERGTIEFSALPGQGGLNSDLRPLGEETMMVSNTSLNPHLTKLLETQQLQMNQNKESQDEIGKRIDKIDSQMDTLAQKIDDVSKVLVNSFDTNTSTLTFRNLTDMEDATAAIQQQQTQVQTATTKVEEPVQKTTTTTTEVPAATATVTTEATTTIDQEESKKNDEKSGKKLKKSEIIGIVVWSLFVVGIIIVGVLLLTGVIKI